MKIEFRHAKEDFFKVSTPNGSYEKQVRLLGSQHVDQHLAKIGLDPRQAQSKIIDGYLKWHNRRRTKIETKK